jgi:Cof subfamily protein (haloacid dehalogenase superfamily)
MPRDPSSPLSGRDILIAALTDPEPDVAREPETELEVEPEPINPRPVIRLVAIDLDGTLLNDTKQVSVQTANALRCLPQRGVKMVIASARPPRSVRQIHSMLALDTLSIHYNGALIWDEVGKKVIEHTPMAGALVTGIIAQARSQFPDVLVSCEVLDRWYTDRFEQSYTTETGRLFRPDVIAPLETFCNQPITKLMLLGHPDMISELNETLPPGLSEATCVRCDPELLQIMDSRANKAAALRKVADFYSVPLEQIMAIGDAANDVEMLEAAGIAVAVDNAHPSVKAVADWIAPSNNDHGVHAALRRYGLCD